MKSIAMVSTATAIAPIATATTTAQAPAPKKMSKRARKGIMVRTIKMDFDQSGELSDLISRHMDQQRWAFNKAVREKLNDPSVTEFDINKMLTKWRDAKAWLIHDEDARAAGLPEACDSRVQRAGLRQGLDAVQKFMESNGTKRRNKIMWKKLARHEREREAKKAARLVRNGGDVAASGTKDGGSGASSGANLPSNKWSNKRNKWSHTNDLFSRKGEKRRSLSMFEKPAYKGNGMLMLPGVGTVKVHGDVDGLDMRSFQLVEATKKITGRTEDRDRTYRLHIQVGIKAPKPSESTVIRGVDMGIVHNAATVDLGTGRHKFYDIPKDSRRSKNDGISKMYSELSRKRGGSGNRRIKQDGKSGASGADSDNGKNTGGNNTNCNNRNKPRKPKSRGYKEIQRRIRKKREKIANRQTNWERHASKNIADGAGIVAMEDLNLIGMTAKAKGSSAKTGLNREMSYSRPGMFQRQIEGACANAGVTVIKVDPRGTSMTCHVCGHKDKGSRISQGRFQCTNDKCNNDINADKNAAHNIAVKAAGIVVPRREIPARDYSRTLRKQNARTKRWRDCKNAKKRQKYRVYFCI